MSKTEEFRFPPMPPIQTRPGFDVHRYSAAVALGCHSSEVTDEQRRLQKSHNFVVLYGTNREASRRLYDEAAAKWDAENQTPEEEEKPVNETFRGGGRFVHVEDFSAYNESYLRATLQHAMHARTLAEHRVVHALRDLNEAKAQAYREVTTATRGGD